ncbi:hypothetical protein AVEN_208524-1 [Araneus ventricosus]|uniref:Endonuclease/exonuclease/phosphatase domain-containing protein n=1 Tax=Araneus ventricosus TaxID=182803 RepID=A0A4Y2E6D0_ARAVE|nr:hypothetical protein AVEN_208524-1 [Araneus ventricosus]
MEIQSNFDKQVEENITLWKLIETQQATIDSLQSKIALLESNFEYSQVQSPDFGNNQRSLTEINHFSVVDDISEIGFCGVVAVPPFFLFFHAVCSVERPRDQKGGLITAVCQDIPAQLICLLNMKCFTRYQGTQAPSLLDLFICSADLVNMISIEISHDLYDSDHCPIFIFLCNFGMKSLQTRKYINWGQFSKKVNAHLHSQGEVSFLDEFTQIFQESANSSSYSFTRSAHTHSPWWDVKCNYLKALRRKLLRKAKSYPTIMNWAAYKEMAAVLRKYVKSCKHSFWEKTCQEAASSHQAFRIIQALLNKDGSPSISNLVLSSGITLTALIAQANAIAASLIKRAPDERISLDFSADYSETSDDKTLNRPFSFREFENALAKTRNKSPGTDQVTKKMLSCVSDENIHKILDMFNNLWTNMIVPEWKIAKIIPILKPGENAVEVTTYRPIALTSV